MKHVTKALLASASSVVLAGSAFAADLPLKAGPAAIPYSSWTGPYIGAHLGVGSMHSTCDTVGDYNCAGNSEVAANTAHDTSFLIGVQAGYDWQDRYFVYGVVADWTWTNLKGTTFGSSGSHSWESRVNWLASFRGRAGLALDNNLIYVTGGAAIGDVTNKVHIGSADSYNQLNQTRVGWVAGVGFEHKFNRNWSAMAEYLHYDLGTWSQSYTSGDSYTHQFNTVVDVARLGLNYRW